MLTEVSPLLNLLRSHAAGDVPSRSHMDPTSTGCEEPEKILTRRIAGRCLYPYAFFGESRINCKVYVWIWNLSDEVMSRMTISKTPDITHATAKLLSKCEHAAFVCYV